MCKFFSMCSDGNGNPIYFDWDKRKQILDGVITNVESPDSHTSIATYFGHKGEKEDKLNKYEYNPLTKQFTIDQINTTDDKSIIEKWVRELDFKTIVPHLNLYPIKNPLETKAKKVSKKDLLLLKEWINVRASVGDSVGDSVRASVLASVWDSVRDSVGASVGDSVRASVWASVWDSVWDSVNDSVDDSVWASVRDSVWDSVDDSVDDSVWASVRDSVGDSVWGPHDANWLGFYNFFREVCHLVDQTEKLVGLQILAQTAGWALPHQNICWVSERHNILARDERGRLHSLVGPACAYPDGWAIYAIHGVRVPQAIIERPQDISVTTIEKETNAEVRRVLIDRYRYDAEIKGAAAYIRDSGGKRLDHDESFGTLWKRDVNGDEPIVMLEVINSTREPNGRFKHYFLRVPPTITKAHEAAAWTFNQPTKNYTPQIET